MAVQDFDVDDFFSEPENDDNTAAAPSGVSPIEVVARWRDEGPLVRVATGIDPLDSMCRGGLPIPWRVFIIGAPAAGKTFVTMAIADSIARRLESEGLCVGILGVDEEPDDLTVRLAQMAGFSVAEAEQRDPAILDSMAERLSLLNVTLYDSSFTIEAAAADLAKRAKEQDRRSALFVDSIHAAKSAAALALETDSVRLLIQANVDAVRAVATSHRMLVVSTAEANRAAYRTEDAADQVNDMASGAESRAIEFAGQTVMMIRTPKGHPNVSHVRVAKNRRASTGEFWLRLDRDHHSVKACEDPNNDPSEAAEKSRAKRTTNKRALEHDACVVLKIVAATPGLGEKSLRARIALSGLKMGVDRLEAVKELLVTTGRLENRVTQHGKRSDAHYFATAPIERHE